MDIGRNPPVTRVVRLYDWNAIPPAKDTRLLNPFIRIDSGNNLHHGSNIIFPCHHDTENDVGRLDWPWGLVSTIEVRRRRIGGNCCER
jgi:hypothetical protein